MTKLVKELRTVSKPGAVITVKEVVLTEAGRRALTTKSKGITYNAFGKRDSRPSLWTIIRRWFT